MKTYKRVVPRDFFNESKLLKCLGQFQLVAENSKTLQVTFNNGPFEIQQDQSDGSLYCANYTVTLLGDVVTLVTTYNSKESYPLLATWRNETYYVFRENGELMPSDFLNAILNNGGK